MVITNKWKSIMTWSLQNHLYMYIDCYRQDMSPEVILIPPVTGNDQIWLGSDLLTIHVLVLCVIAKKYQIVWRSWTPGVVLTPWNTKWPTILRHVKIRTPRSYIFLFLVLKVLNRNKGHERWGWSWHPPPLKKWIKIWEILKNPPLNVNRMYPSSICHCTSIEMRSWTTGVVMNPYITRSAQISLKQLRFLYP